MRRGFTLIELLVAVSVLVLLGSFLIPTFQTLLAQYQLSSTATQVTNFLRLTEQKTVTEQQIYGVTITNSASTIPQFQYNPANGNKTSITPTYTLPSNIVIGAVNFGRASDIRFSTAGAPNVSGSFNLTDTVRNRNKTIFINPSGSIVANQPEF